MRAFVLSLTMLLALPAFAGSGPGAIRKQAESSMRVSGFIVIGTDGAVQSHELDPKTPLTPALAEFVGKALVRWHFEPIKVDGNVVRARVPMSLRLVANRADDGSYNVRIASTHFGSEQEILATDTLQKAEWRSPQYPKDALRVGGKGIVYLIVQVGPDGKVMNVDAEQVNLRVVGSANQMTQLRKQFADAAVRAARTWTFIAPTTGKGAGEASWLARVPVDFRIFGDSKPKPGEWETYIPGPRNIGMPWARESLKTAGSPDALPDSGVFPLEQGAKLLTPPAA